MRCSAASLAREESMVGSAPTARRWLMIEVAKAWEPEALATPPITESLRAILEEAERAHNSRVVLVRRPGRSAEREGGRWFAVDSMTGRQVQGQWTCGNDLEVAARALGQPLSQSTDYAPPLLLVCTHGTRDLCCAIDGRQLARTLTAAFGDDVWECTHLGGHRFAPTFAVLPDGAVYGRVRVEEAAALVTAHREGRIRTPRLRGFARWSPPEQAAMVAVLERFGPAGLEDLSVLATERTGELEWSVRLGCDEPLPEMLVARVVGRPLPPEPLSCGPAPGKPSTAYDVVELAVED